MSIEILRPTSRDEWLDLRSKTIGASEVAALLGAHPYQTAYGLYCLKAGLLKVERTESGPMRRGRHLEQVAVNFLQEERSDWQVTANPMPGGIFYRDVEMGVSCTPDAFIADPSRHGRGVCQIKSVEPSVFRKAWKGEDGIVDPPLYAVVQAIQEASLVEASFAMVCALVISFEIELHIVEVPIHAGLMAKLRTRVAEFWDMVESGTEPPPDYARDGEAIAQIYGSDGRTIDLSGENELPTILDEDERLREQVKAAEERRGAIKAQVRHKLAGATFGYCNGWQITNKEQSRSGHYVKPSTFAVLRAKRTFKEKAYVASGSF